MTPGLYKGWTEWHARMALLELSPECRAGLREYVRHRSGHRQGTTVEQDTTITNRI